MSEANKKVCSDGPKLIFACSGAADVGAVADQAARRMTKESVGNMFCLAGVGGQVSPIMDKTKSASKVLAIDGCPLNCLSETLKKAGFDQFEHIFTSFPATFCRNAEYGIPMFQNCTADGFRITATIMHS